MNRVVTISVQQNWHRFEVTGQRSFDPDIRVDQ